MLDRLTTSAHTNAPGIFVLPDSVQVKDKVVFALRAAGVQEVPNHDPFATASSKRISIGII